MSIAEHLNALRPEEAREALRRCCGSTRWVDGMVQRRPFPDDAGLFAAAQEVWADASGDDVLEALSHHPRIGADLDTLRQRFASTASWSAGEQSAVAAANEDTLVALRDGNRDYEARYGHIFVVCATGRSAAQMLELLRSRMHNDPATELSIAAREQAKITRLRLEKLLP